MRSDSDIRRDVEDAIRLRPRLTATQVAVAVNSGVVTLTGFVWSTSQRSEAEIAAKRVTGVVGLANDIEIRLPGTDQRPDPEITSAAAVAIRNQLPYSWENIQGVVTGGWITLEGEVAWNYQRKIAEEAVAQLLGVKGVTNAIRLKPKCAPAQIKQKIEEEFRRRAEIDAMTVTVEARGGEVILRGIVRSLAERQEAERIARSAPGVMKVDNRIALVSKRVADLYLGVMCSAPPFAYFLR